MVNPFIRFQLNIKEEEKIECRDDKCKPKKKKNKYSDDECKPKKNKRCSSSSDDSSFSDYY